jgi:hypothetical protein
MRNNLGETPLLLAAANEDRELVKLFLLHGANPTLPDKFGQTAISVARAKGHTDIVDVLSSRSLRGDHSLPPTQTTWRPNARRWLAASIILGASLVIGITYFGCEHSISAEQFLRLAETNQIRNVDEDRGYLVGELGDRFQFSRDPMWLPSREFWLRKSNNDEVDKAIHAHARVINPNYNFHGVESRHSDLFDGTWPGDWVIVIMLAWPMAVLGLTFSFLVSLDCFPFFTLSSPRGRAGMGESSPGASATGAGNAAR